MTKFTTNFNEKKIKIIFADQFVEQQELKTPIKIMERRLSAKVSPNISPKISPKITPSVPPKISPLVSPKCSPISSPAKVALGNEEHGNSGKKTTSSPPEKQAKASEDTQEQLRKMLIKMIDPPGKTALLDRLLSPLETAMNKSFLHPCGL